VDYAQRTVEICQILERLNGNKSIKLPVGVGRRRDVCGATFDPSQVSAARSCRRDLVRAYIAWQTEILAPGIWAGASRASGARSSAMGTCRTSGMRVGEAAAIGVSGNFPPGRCYARRRPRRRAQSRDLRGRRSADAQSLPLAANRGVVDHQLVDIVLVMPASAKALGAGDAECALGGTSFITPAEAGVQGDG